MSFTKSLNMLSKGRWLLLALVFFAHAVTAQVNVSNPRAYTEADSETLGQLAEGFGINAGGMAPDATLRSIHGEAITLSELWEDQHVMLIFYRGGWCPYCNAQIRDITVKYDGFEERNLLPVLVSVDEPDAASLLTAAYDVPFPVMSDSDLDGHQAYNVVLTVDEEEYQARLARGTDMEAFSGEDHHSMAVPSTFLIEKGGNLLWSHVDTNFRVRPSAKQLLEVADSNL